MVPMDKKFKYEFNPLTGLFYKYYYGIITISDITTSWEYAIQNKLIPKETKGFLLDYRKATLNIKIDENPKIADFYKNHLEVFGNLKIAIITENPKDVVIPILVESLDDGYSSKPFCTVEAAVKWIFE